MQPRMRTAVLMAFVLSGSLSAGPTFAQVGGNLAQFPPEDLVLEVSTSTQGQPLLSKDESQLVTGDYYRLNVKCTDVLDDQRGWRIEMTDLLKSSHLRIVSVGDIELHMQGLSFHAIECDEVGTARISFVPIRPGTYDLEIGSVPLPFAAPGEQRPDRKSAVAKMVVR